MEYEIDDLNSTLLNVYINNLKYLEKNQPKVFKKIDNLSKQLGKGEVVENYFLECNKEVEYFDIFDINKQKFIYGFNTFQEAELRTEKVDFSVHHSINLLRTDPRNNKFTLNHGLKNSKNLIDFLNEKIDFENINFSKIFKFIFIGVGCGVHIHEIYKKVNSMTTLIIEPNLEIFRLSLFLVDYSLFEKENKKLFLSVDETVFERDITYHQFNEYHSYMNYNVKHHLFSIEYEYLLNEIIDFYGHNYVGAFSHIAVLEVFNRTLNFFKNKFRFFQKDLVLKSKPLKDKKVLLISAGPSLDKELDWIRKNQNKFIIICVDVILRKLEKNNIIPDIVFSIDPSHLCAKYLTCENKDFLRNSAIVFLSQQHQDVLDVTKDLNTYFSQVLFISQRLGYSFSLSNVGIFSFAFSLFLGGNKLYTIGNDAAFNQETGNRYAEDSSHKQKEILTFEENNNKDKKQISQEDIIEVKGNIREIIKSNRNLLNFKYDYETYLHSLKKTNLKLYNLSDGAYIEGLIPISSNDIYLENTDNKTFNAKNIFDSITIDNIDDINYEEDIKIINSIVQRLRKTKKLNIKDKNDFLQNKLDITIWILEQSKKTKLEFFGNLFLKYINMIDIYVNFTLNLKQKDLHTKENLEKIMTYWCDNSIEFFKEIKDTFERNRV